MAGSCSGCRGSVAPRRCRAWAGPRLQEFLKALLQPLRLLLSGAQRSQVGTTVLANLLTDGTPPDKRKGPVADGKQMASELWSVAPNLWAILSGPLPAHPSALMDSDANQMVDSGEFINALEAGHDHDVAVADRDQRLAVAHQAVDTVEHRRPVMGQPIERAGREVDFFARISADFDAARDAILRITGQSALLETGSVIGKSIALRNPYTDVLNLVQLELLRRYRAAQGEGERVRLRELLFLSINGIAAAMQSTG